MNLRYNYCPQLKVYDEMGFRWISHLMFMNRPNYRSSVCNTDSYGMRFNSKEHLDCNHQSILDLKLEKEKSIMVGSSTTFGVGATSDEKTIPGILSKAQNFVYNFGGRAFNGFQEIILTEMMINKLKNIKNILLYSGMNDVYMHYNKAFLSKYPGPFYFHKSFLDQMENINLNFKRKLLKFFLPDLKIDFKHANFKQLIKALIHPKNKNFENKYTSFPNITLQEIVERNINIWKLISKAMNSKIYFFLPPFLPWSKAKENLTNEENEINFFINNLSDAKSNKYYDKIENDYYKILNLFEFNCKKNNIEFYDCNTLFKLEENKNKWLFVDKTHLTDYGNQIISEFISSKI